MAGLDLKHIPELDGSTPVVASIETGKIICCLNGMKNVENIMPLLLGGGAFDVYLQMKVEEKEDLAQIKAALFKAFA